jgi:hypothetical protein
MRTYRKFILAALAAVLALSLGAGTAAALRSLELRAGGAITANALRLSFTEVGGLIIESNVTVTGELNTRIAKRAGAVVGSIRTCAANNGRDTSGLSIVATIRCELNRPWPITYNSIAGTLPSITSTSLTIERASFLLALVRSGTIRLNECLYGGSAEPTSERNPIVVNTTRSPITELIVEPRTSATQLLRANLEETGQACAASGRLSGTFRLTVAQTLALV